MYDFQPIPLEQARGMVSHKRETAIAKYKEALNTKAQEALASTFYPRISISVPHALIFLSKAERETILLSFAESYQKAGYEAEVVYVGSPSQEFSVKISFRMA